MSKDTSKESIDFFRNMLLAVQVRNYSLTDKEREIATTFINDSWYGTFDELIECVKKLSKEDK